MSASLTAADLVGTWTLLTWTSEGEDGIVHPMGEVPEGVLVYTADGTMITTIGRADRPLMDDGDMLAGSVDQRLDAMTTFIAYSGMFRVEGGDVVHDVRMSLFTNWVGTIQRRHVTLSADGRELTLSSEPLLLRGRLSTQRLTWERVAR
ncbi:MAG TPA: lipocalin-like domain-containing protein [Candidatus Sulfomarinibacteraceae bacterium]|nr:lipocalin-like domain-containing protein [Candidatus Sulfomarinibacteraceae bacterium]